MKFFIIIISFVFSCTIFSCKENTSLEAKAKLPIEMVTTTFNIEGMHCEVGCAARVEKKLSKLEGVETATIDFEKKLATVTYNKNTKTAEDLVETVMKTSKDYVVSNIETKTNVN